MSCSSNVCHAPKADQIMMDQGSLQALLAHLLAIRSQLDSVLASQVHVQEAVLVMKESAQSFSRNHRQHGAESSRGTLPRAVNTTAQDAAWEDADYVHYEKVQDDLDKEVKKVESKYIDSGLSQHSTQIVSGLNFKDELTNLVNLAEYEETRRFTYRHMSWTEKLRTMTASQKGALIDALTGALVVANTVVIGLSADDTSWPGWQWLDVCFTLGFLSEMIAKMVVQGFLTYLRDQWHWLGCGLVFFDLVQTVMWIVSVDQASDAFALARVVRVARLSRISRVLRVSVSQNLVRMTHLFSGSISTILWAMVLVILAVYVMAIVFRETVGRSTLEYETTGKYFDSVPRSTMTIFRCAFGDCTTNTGNPIFEFISEFHGAVLVIAFGVFNCLLVLGLFNVISAIFVEKTLQAAVKDEKVEKAKRLLDSDLWVTRIAKLLRTIMRGHDPEWDGKLSEDVDSILEVSLSEKEFSALVQDEDAAKALDDLDVSREDRGYLAAILDPDSRKAWTVTEIVRGIRALRGEPRRSDIVAVDLLVRSLQSKVADLAKELQGLKECSFDNLKLLTSLVKGEVSRHKFTQKQNSG